MVIKSSGKVNKANDDYLENNNHFDSSKNFQNLKDHELLLIKIRDKVENNRKIYNMDEKEEVENDST